jgi:hypothetical protein
MSGSTIPETSPAPKLKRKRSPRKTKSIGREPSAAISAHMRRRWADPEYRAERLEALDKVRNPRARLGVPDGMRKSDADAAWAHAATLADRFIKIMEDKGELPEVVVPGSEAEMATEALREAFKISVGPHGVKERIAAINTVLNFTKSKPESKSKLTVNKAEEWLAELATDMKTGDDRADG